AIFEVPDDFDGCEIEYVGAPRYRLLVKDKDYKQAEDTMKRFVQLVTERSKKEQVEVEFSKA
ncbi:MAG: translation initiation factor IF-2 subunit alpha, partial [Thermoplasmata archaeon]